MTEAVPFVGAKMAANLETQLDRIPSAKEIFSIIPKWLTINEPAIDNLDLRDPVLQLSEPPELIQIDGGDKSSIQSSDCEEALKKKSA